MNRRLCLAALLWLPVTVSAVFPTVESVTETAFATPVATHNVDMPATVNSGDLLVILITRFNMTGTWTTPTGWTLLYDDTSSSTSDSAAYVKSADGTEGGTSVAVVHSSDGRAGAAQAYRITGWSGTLSEVEEARANGSSVSPDPPSLTPAWGAEDTLWIVAAHTSDDDVVTDTFSTNYGNGVDTVCGGGGNASGRISSARRELNAASDDPGVFALASTESWVAATIAIRTGGSIIPLVQQHLRRRH